MTGSEIFIGIMTILLVFNWLYVSANPLLTNTMLLGTVTGLVTTAIIVSIVTGIQVVGSGFNGSSVKILFGVCALLQILFSLNFVIADIQVVIGLGLINNLFVAFSGGDFFGLGFFISTVFGIIALVSGLLVIIGGTGE